jgi:hypothetical protein
MSQDEREMFAIGLDRNWDWCCDNGPELTTRHFLAWCVERQIELVHIQPGKPTQNAHV